MIYHKSPLDIRAYQVFDLNLEYMQSQCKSFQTQASRLSLLGNVISLEDLISPKLADI